MGRKLPFVAIVVLIAFFVGRNNREKPRAAAPPLPAETLSATPQGAALAAPESVVVAPVEESPRDFTTIQERIREGAPGTYLLPMLAEQRDTLARWPDRRNEPLRVWIQPSAEIPGWDRSYPLAAERAFEEWQAAGFPIRFDMIRDSADTDIKILWVQQMAPEEGRRIGVARRVRDQEGWLVRAEVVIAIHDRGGRPLPAETVHGTARHEVGHVLGLGHSDSPGDVMFPESRTPVISAADRATLHLLYILPPGPVK